MLDVAFFDVVYIDFPAQRNSVPAEKPSAGSVAPRKEGWPFESSEKTRRVQSRSISEQERQRKQIPYVSEVNTSTDKYMCRLLTRIT